MTLKKLGRKLKTENPGRWDEHSDLVVARLAIKHGIAKDPRIKPAPAPIPRPAVAQPTPPPVIVKRNIETPQPGLILPGKQADYHENQTRDFQAKAKLQIAQINHPAHVEASVLAAQHEVDTLPDRLHELDEQAKAVHATTIAGVEATKVLTEKALERNLDPAIFGLVRLEEEKVSIEIAKARGFAGIEIAKHRELKQIDLEAKSADKRIDIEAALTYKLADKHSLLHIQGLVLQELEQAHAIKNANEAEELKEKKLEVVNEVIIGLKQDLRGLLQGDKQKGLDVSDTDSDS